MKEMIRLIKIGTYKVKTSAHTPEECLRITKDAGFDFVCLAAHCLYPGDTTGFTPELCGKVGIDFDNVHLTSNGTHAIWAEGEDGDAIIDRYIFEIKLFSSLGVKTGICHVTWGTKTPPPISELGLHRLEKVAECADKCGFTVALENSAFPEYLHYVLPKLAAEYKNSIGYCFDSGHRNAFAPGEDFLAQYGNLLCATHIQDNEGKTDMHILPGDGSINWDKVTSELASTAFARKMLCAEVAGAYHKERPGKTAAEIRESLSSLAIIDDESLLRIYDGGFSVYEDITYEQYIARLADHMRKIAAAVEAKAGA